MEIDAIIKGVRPVSRFIRSEHARYRKNQAFVTRREAFRLRNELKKQIRAGAPGGRRFKSLTRLARRKRGLKSWRADKPLRALAAPIFYHVRRNWPLEIAIGWTGPRVPENIKRIARRQQAGFTQTITDPTERFFRHRAEEIPERSPYRRLFYLRRFKSMFKTEPRPVIDPFWKAQRRQAIINIRRNFRRKQAGYRI